MKSWQKIVLRLLYLTPFGYLLSTIYLLSGEESKGIYLELERNLPVRAIIKKKPTLSERIDWLVNAVFLLVQGYFVLYYEIAGEIGGGFAIVAIIFGLVSLISAIAPGISWNKKIF